MDKKKDIYFKKNGLYAKTSHIMNGDAFVTVEAVVENQLPETAEVWVDIHMHQLIDNGKPQMDEEPGIKAAGAVKVCVPASGSRAIQTTICVREAVLWELDAPTLYVVEAVLYRSVAEGEALPNPRLLAGMAQSKPHSMKMLDFIETRFGIREISVDAKYGLCINGTSVFLKGKDIKHFLSNMKELSFGELYQQVKVYRDSACNVMRVNGSDITSDFVDCCNRFGVMLLVETTEDEATMRWRSAPAVIAWMLADRMLCDENACEAVWKAQEDVSSVKAFDATRPVGVLCDASFGMQAEGSFDAVVWTDQTEAICAACDFVGYPKENTRYKETHVLFPNRVMIVFSDEKEASVETAVGSGYLMGIVQR